MLGDNKVEVKVGGDFDPVPVDKYTVQIADVDQVTQFNQFKGEDTTMLKYQFVILDAKPMQDDENTRGRFLWSRINPVLSGKSNLMKLVKAVYGRDLTHEEMEDFDPEALVGKQLDVMVEQNPSKDGTTIYNNIVTYTKCLKPLEQWMEVQGQVSATKTSAPATRKVETPDLEPKGSLKLEDVFPANKKSTGDAELDAILNDEEDEDEVAVLEAELALKKAKAKAKKAQK